MTKYSKLLLLLTVSLGFILTGWQQGGPSGKIEYVATAADTSVFLQKRQLAEADAPVAARCLSVARSFLNAPYVTGVLDRSAEEVLTVNLRELDCWTFMENCLAIALANDDSLESMARQIRGMRYWGGLIDGYGSRIHYFTGWLLQAEKSGMVRDLTKDFGGRPYEKKVGYISARPHKYPKIRDEETLRDIRNAEKRINSHQWYYIPQHEIIGMEHLIQDGDIICLTSVKPDLDVAHQGFAVRRGDRVHLLHASSLAKKVIVSGQPLAEYVLAQPGQSGIMVARLN
ncbi:MAG: hypothetical protein RJA20_2106 [Bacteroidota bacterium]|jgi:hypothetical protein